MIKELLEIEMKRFDGFTDILYKLLAISESIYYLSRLPYENFFDGDTGSNVLRTVSLINRISILALVASKCCVRIVVCEDRMKQILSFWVPANYLWFLAIDAPFFMNGSAATEIGFILDLTMIVTGSNVSILLSSSMLKDWMLRLMLISAYVVAIGTLLIKAICSRSEIQVTDFDQYYFDALIFVGCSIFWLSVIVQILYD